MQMCISSCACMHTCMHVSFMLCIILHIVLMCIYVYVSCFLQLAYLYPHLFILDESFQTMLLYVNGAAAILNERESARLTKVLFKITSLNFFEIQDTLTLNKSPITKGDIAPKKFEIPSHGEVDESGTQQVSSPSFEPMKVTMAMAKDEILFHIVCCIQQKVSQRFAHVMTDLIPQSLLESNFRHQVSIFLTHEQTKSSFL